ncbi:MAG TPA: plasma-membrane proton-efflux P-type ATPase, partial [Nitrososphaeraceae archaeon]|nr:plasma-membrane proton-efflux P-type ATPase [Nitrososphaeraceae archaeon]
MSLEETFKNLSSSQEGLSSTEAEERLQKYGYNEIEERKVNPVRKFLGYFWSPIPWMIEAAAIISAIISHWEDFWIIVGLLFLNAVVAFWQEHKADNAISLLKQRLSAKAHVLRDRKWTELAARELVPGDVVRIRLGDIVPADVKLFDGDYLLIDQSALTGESLPVERHVAEDAYSSSIVQKGEMTALVVKTGVNTYFGKTAKLVEEAKTKSHFQKAVIKIGDYLIAFAIALIVLIFLIAIFRQESLLQTLQFALVLLIAAIPAALPAVLSVTMAVGATFLAKKQAIVSKLVSIEEMAGVDILCSDKTGTITENKLHVADVTGFDQYTEADVILYATFASREEDNDPIDNAIIDRCSSLKIIDKIDSYKSSSFKPFDPVIKRAEATVLDQNSGTTFNVSKGAPQVILSLSSGDKRDIVSKVQDKVDMFASKGYRSLGVARTDTNGNWKFIGLISLSDPPRDDSKDTISTAQSMGVDVKMITGDHAAIAKEISKEVNLGTNILEALTILDRKYSNKLEEERMIEEADGFAQVFPEHKYRIVELLQEKGHIVGMTGDGVNDAPALKKADIGIAVEGATDAAKSAAGVVLTRPGLSVIIDAIKESRRIFQRMNNYAIYRIGETIRILLFLTLSIIVFNFYPITPLMIVLLAILNDMPIITIAYDNVRYSAQPERWDMRTVLGIATILGIIGVASTFILLYIGTDIFQLNQSMLQSFIYLKLSVAGHLFLFVARTKNHFWSIKPALPLFMAVICTQITATL